MSRASLGIALVGVTSQGYRSLAMDYLEAAVRADLRLSDIAIARIDVDIASDAWWTAYRVLGLDPAPDIVAFPVYCWTARHVYEASRVIAAASPRAHIVVGGPEVGPIAEDVLSAQPHIRAVVRGEGEQALPDLIHCLARGGDPGAVPGVTARDRERIVHGPDRPLLTDLDTLASPFRGRVHATDGSAYIETYRGCPHRCAYCYEGKGSTLIRSFSWERIAADIDAVASSPGMRSFSVIDPVFNLTTDRLERLADVLAPHAARGISLHTVEVDIERVDARQAALLAKCGVVSVETGPQSVGPRALSICHRSFDRDRFATGVAACREEGISVECDLIVGLPGDTSADVIEGINFAIGLDPGKVQLSTLHVLPGTELWLRATELGLVYDSEPPHELISTADIGYAELRRLEELGNAAAAIYRARIEP